jgi:hypothetical protein
MENPFGGPEYEKYKSMSRGTLLNYLAESTTYTPDQVIEILEAHGHKPQPPRASGGMEKGYHTRRFVMEVRGMGFD